MTSAIVAGEAAKRSAEQAPARLRVTGVSKQFRQGANTVKALNSVSLSASDGDFIAVMGASGSGKSTLLHTVAGLTSIDEGRVVVDETDLSTLDDAQLTRFRRRKIGLVFQAFNLIPSLTAEENVRLPILTQGGMQGAEERLNDLFDRLGIAARRRHRPDALSGGEQQRVAIARALLTDPALVLADEPTGSLDSVSGQNICRILRELSDQQQRAIVVVTHEPAVAIWAKRVVVMKDGCVLSEFTTDAFPDAHSLAAHYQDLVNPARR